MTVPALADWIGHTGSIKPEVQMPSYEFLPPEDLAALGHYLEALK